MVSIGFRFEWKDSSAEKESDKVKGREGERQNGKGGGN